MKNHLIYFLTLLNLFSALECLGSTDQYTFLVSNHMKLEVVEPPHSIDWKMRFPNLSAEDRNSLCLRAAEEATLDVVNDPPAHPKIHYFERGYDLIHLIKCRTVPPAYLHLGSKSGTSIVVAMEKNSFSDTQFSLRMISSDLIPCSKMLEDDPQYFEMDSVDFQKEVNNECRGRLLKTSLIGKFQKNKDRLHLCDAARKFLGKTQSSSGLVPVFQKDYSPEAGIFYEDKNGNGRHYALRCPTMPVMYLHYENLRVSSAVKIVLVASEAK